MHKLTSENIDVNTLRFLYDRYKGFIIPFFAIVISFLLFGRVIVPQIQDLLAAQEEQKLARESLTVIQDKLNLLKSISDSTLDSQLAILSSALPIDKDFFGVLHAISDASSKVGVTVGDFTFRVGSLSTIEDESEFLTFDLDLTINGGAYVVDDFIDKLKASLPLSEITQVLISKDSSSVKIHFYYKPLVALKPNDNLRLIPVSQEGLSLINELSTFSIPPRLSSVSDIPLLPSSPSASSDIVPLPSSRSANPFFDI